MARKQQFYLDYFFSFQFFTLSITFFDLSSHEYLTARFEELLDNLSFKSLFPIKNSILAAKLSGLSGSKSKQFTSYDDFKDKIQNVYKIRSLKEWDKFKSSQNYPNEFPKAPDGQYKKKGWKDFPTLFGRPDFDRMVKIIHKEKSILSKAQYWKYIKSVRKKIIYPYPRNPDMVYEKEFKKNGGWYYFLGIKFKLGITKKEYDPNKVKRL